VAQRLVTLFVDDLDGTNLKAGDGETVEFAIDGTAYAIDLSAKNAKAMRAALSTYIDSARKTSASRSRRRGSSPRTDRAQLQAIREWARSNGYEVADRGRIPAAVIDAYHAS
jgi:hypothetical protein